jgi:saccharopine dehydrogenase-like NADP-dependent oxidoreductase
MILIWVFPEPIVKVFNQEPETVVLGAEGLRFFVVFIFLNIIGFPFEIICADYDSTAAQELSDSLEKAKALMLDARDVNNVIRATEGCDLIVNGLPLEYNLTVMEAALAANASYVDMAGPMESIGFVESYKLIFSEWHKKFEEKGLTALAGCGSSPGLANVLARESVDKMDTCDTIGIYVYEGVILEEGAFLVRVDGHKEGSPVRIDCYVNAPGLVESFEKAGLSHEAYLTGQCASVFVKLLVDDVFVEKGLFAPEQLHAASRHYYFQELAKLGVTVDEIIERKLNSILSSFITNYR